MSIGARIKTLRTRKDESLQQLADAVGVSPNHIWEIETERSTNPKINLLKKIADHFNVPVSFLLEERPSTDTQIFGQDFCGMSEADKKLLYRIAERLMQTNSK